MIISKNVNIFVSAKILPVKLFSNSKVFPGAKYVGKVKRKVVKTAFHNIKNLTDHNLNITKFGRSHYERFCEINVLENCAQSLKGL